MSMYALVAGDGHQIDRGQILLGMLGNPEPGRYRDAWVEKDPDGGDPIIAIYTRNGGGNRESYEFEIELLQLHPQYIRDADDDFDSTYATFYFRAPKEHAEMLREVEQEHVDTSQRWLDLIAVLERAK